MKRLLLLLAMLALPAAARAGAPALNDYAYGSAISVPEGAAVCEFKLPPEVYRAVKNADCSDVAVFNGYGEVVPFALVLPEPVRAKPERKTVPVFPIYVNGRRGGDDLSLYVKTGKDGAVVDVRSGGGGAEEKTVSAYVLDASAVKAPLSALLLDWTPPGDGAMHNVRVKAGDDLRRWRDVGGDAVLASLSYDGRRLEADRVELPRVEARYYMITAASGEGLPEITGARAEIAPGEAEPARDWVGAQGVRVKDGEYMFDLYGRMPADRLRVRFPQENTVAEASFYSRPKSKGAWTGRGGALLYDLAVDGKRLRSPGVRVAPRGDRYWMMDIKGAGIGSGAPVLEAGWAPHRVVFAARGKGPFTLAYGSSSRKDAAGPEGRYLAQRLKDEPATVKPAHPGRQKTLGGEDALKTRIKPPDMKRVALWASLILGVVLLAWMANRLYRQMGADGPGA